MTKQGNFTQRTPQAKKQSDQASKQVSKQASGSTNAPHDLVFPATGPSLGTTQPTATITSTEDLQRAAFTTPPQTAPGTNSTEPPPPPIRNKGPELGADNLTLEGVATELAPSDFVSQNYETLDEVSPPRHRKERRREDNRRPPVFGRIGKQVSGTQTANLQNLDTHENNDWRISVHDRLGSRDVHSRLGQRRSSSESPPSSDSEDSRRKRRRRVSLSSEDTSDNEDAETGHWKSKNKYREDEDEDMSLPWRRQKVDAFTRRISDFSEDKRRRMPANVKTYDGTGDPDDHLKIFESAATIENWPQPVWCHMFNSTLVGNARNWFSKLPRRSIDGFEELRRAFRLNFTQRKKCAKNPVELARVKQRQGESTSVYMERYKDECIHVKACPEILKISGFMNGINNPELIKRLNDRVPQTFDELMKRTRSFIQGRRSRRPADKAERLLKQQVKNSPGDNPMTSSSSLHNSYRSQRVAAAGNTSGFTTSTAMYIDGMSISSILITIAIQMALLERPGSQRLARSIPAHGMLKFHPEKHATQSDKLEGHNSSRLPEQDGIDRGVASLYGLGTAVCALFKKPRYLCMGTKTLWPFWRTVHKLVEEGLYAEKSIPLLALHPVMVQKRADVAGGLCLDFTDLNKACPQDWFHIIVSRQSLPLFNTQEVLLRREIRWTTGQRKLSRSSSRSIDSTSPTSRTTGPGGTEELIMYLSATHGAIMRRVLTDRGLRTNIRYTCKVKHSRKRRSTSRNGEADTGVREHNISYRPRTAVKGQILVDFFIEKPETDAVPHERIKLQEPMDLVYGWLSNHGWLGEYVAKEDNMIQYLDKTKSPIQGFDRFTIRQVPRGDNKKADALSKIASTSFAHLSKQVLVEILKNKSISDMEISTVIEEQDPTWMDLSFFKS
ncbi:reverse transcriptase domain-containing protein [Tanacetum coccineum]